MPIDPLFSQLPESLRTELLRAFDQIRENFLVQRWEPSELNGGKLCEVVFRVLEWESSGRSTFTPLGTSIRNFGTSVRRFENQTSLPDGVRFHVPDALRFLYTLRNKRGIGHVGGDVNPNRMDATAVVSTARWVMAELVRLLHGVSATDAEDAVNALTTKDVPVVWEVGEKRRVLVPSLSYSEKTLLLAHAAYPDAIPFRDLFSWCEHSNVTHFRNRVVQRLHDRRVVEFDREREIVYLSPTGVTEAESLIIDLIDLQEDNHP